MCTFPLLVCTVNKLEHRIIWKVWSKEYRKVIFPNSMTILQYWICLFWVSLMTCISILFIFISFCCFILPLMFFLSLHDENFWSDREKKILRNWWIGPSIGGIVNIIVNIYFHFSLLICWTKLSSCFLFSAESS